MKNITRIRNIIDEFMYAFNAYLCNEIINTIPSHGVRLFLYRNVIGLTIGTDSSIGMHTVIINPHDIVIGNNCAIGQFVYLDGRGGLVIDNNVNIAGRSSIYTATHDIKSARWNYVKRSVFIRSHVWIASNAVILPGIEIGLGAVVAAGSVVTKSVNAFTVVGGNPGKKITVRNKKIAYLTKYFPLFY